MNTQNTSFLTFEKFLNAAFEKRSQRNPNYSLRAFARDLGISPANLSKAMNGQRGFSENNLNTIAERLSLSAQEKIIFKSLCEKKFSKSKKSKQEAMQKLKDALLYQMSISDEQVSMVSDWYHMAILALMDSNNFKSDIKWIADELLIHEKVVAQALDRLMTVGAIKKEKNKYISTGNLFVDPKGIPSSAVKKFHHDIIEKADRAIDLQGLDDRDVASIVMCFDKAKMKEAKNKIKKFREEFELEFGPRPEASFQEVYALGIQFFQLTKFKPVDDLQ